MGFKPVENGSFLCKTGNFTFTPLLERKLK